MEPPVLPPGPVLSLPALVALLWGPETSDTWAVKMALLELVVSGDIVLAGQPASGVPRFVDKDLRIKRGDTGRRRYPAALQVVMDGLPLGRSSPEVGVNALVKRILTRYMEESGPRWRRAWRRTGNGFQIEAVYPELGRLGLLVHGTSQSFGRHRETWLLTDAGFQAFTDERAVVHFGADGLVKMVRLNPPAAAEFVDRHGTTLLLVRGLASTFRLLDGQIGETGLNGRESAGGGRIGLANLAKRFGPAPGVDVDGVFHLLNMEVDRVFHRLTRGAWVFGVE